MAAPPRPRFVRARPRSGSLRCVCLRVGRKLLGCGRVCLVRLVRLGCYVTGV
jgi:hypothetical protein